MGINIPLGLSFHARSFYIPPTINDLSLMIDGEILQWSDEGV